VAAAIVEAGADHRREVDRSTVGDVAVRRQEPARRVGRADVVRVVVVDVIELALLAVEPYAFEIGVLD
jgi:hypothetical protein